MNARTGQPIPGLFGIGQGYSLETSDLAVNAEQRVGAKADSVGLYIKQIGNKILNKILPHARPQLLVPPLSPLSMVPSLTTQNFMAPAQSRALTQNNKPVYLDYLAKMKTAAPMTLHG